MQTRKTALLAASAAAILLAFTSIAQATTSYSSVVVYGDSLSDNGNLYGAIGYPPSPYYNGRFSNGTVAVEQLAAKLGAPLYDYAWGGATTGLGNISDGGTQTAFGAIDLPGMLAEVAEALPPSVNVSTSLFVVWGGADDFESGGSLTTAVSDIDKLVADLEAEGATHILVPGLPNIALTPEFYGVAGAQTYSQTFNQLLQASLPANVTYDDTYDLLNTIVANPSSYGLTNVTASCFTGTSVCSNPSQYLFWDDIHPTTAVDSIVAQQFDTAVTTTPEPSSLLLLGSGLVGIAALLRKRRAA